MVLAPANSPRDSPPVHGFRPHGRPQTCSWWLPCAQGAHLFCCFVDPEWWSLGVRGPTGTQRLLGSSSGVHWGVRGFCGSARVVAVWLNVLCSAPSVSQWLPGVGIFSCGQIAYQLCMQNAANTKPSFLLPVFFHAGKDNRRIKGGWHSFAHSTNIYWAAQHAPGTGPGTVDAAMCKRTGGVSPHGAYDLFWQSWGLLCYLLTRRLLVSHTFLWTFFHSKSMCWAYTMCHSQHWGCWCGETSLSPLASEVERERGCTTKQRAWPRWPRHFLRPTGESGNEFWPRGLGKLHGSMKEELVGSRTHMGKGSRTVGNTVKN